MTTQLAGRRVVNIPSLGRVGHPGEMLLQELPGLDKHAQQVFGEFSRMSLSLQTCDVRFLLFDPVLSMHDLLEGRFQVGLSVMHSRLIANGCGEDLATNLAQRCDCLRLLEADHIRNAPRG